MKSYFSAIVIAVVVFSITLLAHDNKSATKTTTKDSKSCCAGMVKEAKLTGKDANTRSDAKTMSKDECEDMSKESSDMDKTKMSGKEKKDANCNMDKTKMSDKMDCCKNDGKMTEAKVKVKTETKQTTEPKSSNK